MKATMSMLVVLIIVAGMGLIGDAIAQPADPMPAASEDSGAGSAADKVKPDKPETTGETNEAGTAEDKPSESTDAKEEAKEDGSTADKAPEKITDQAKGLYDAIRGGKWILAFGFLAMLLGAVGRWLMSKKWEFWTTPTGGYTTAAIMGLSSLGAGIAMTGGFSLDLLMAAAAVAFASMGTHGPAKAAKEKLKPKPAAG